MDVYCSNAGLLELTCACTADVVPPVLDGRTLDVLLITFFCCKAMLYLQAAFLYSLSWKIASAWYTSSWYFWDGEKSSLKRELWLPWNIFALPSIFLYVSLQNETFMCFCMICCASNGHFRPDSFQVCLYSDALEILTGCWCSWSGVNYWWSGH